MWWEISDPGQNVKYLNFKNMWSNIDQDFRNLAKKEMDPWEMGNKLNENHNVWDNKCTGWN